MTPDAAVAIENKNRIRILDIPVDVISLRATVETVTKWAAEPSPRLVFVREVASLMSAREEPKLKAMHDEADLVVPDGMPLVWIAKFRGHTGAVGRVSGADLVDSVCAESLKTGQTHYFFGGKPGVADRMSERLRQKYPGLRIVGTYSPPMREIGPQFVLDPIAIAEIEAIGFANADFVWVGISSPKQEYWMKNAAPIVGRGVFFGVGAAFDFHSGDVERAPKWMQGGGLEWLHRLISEPRRLWRRYLILAPRFAFLAAFEEARERYRRINSGHR